MTTQTEYENLPIQQPPLSKQSTFTDRVFARLFSAFWVVAGEDDERDDFDPLGLALCKTIWLVAVILHRGVKLANWLDDAAYEIWAYYFPQTYPPRERRPLGLPVASPELVAQLQAPRTLTDGPLAPEPNRE